MRKCGNVKNGGFDSPARNAKHWTRKEAAIVRRHYGHRSAAEIGAELGRSERAVARFAARQGMHKRPRRARSQTEWTDVEDALLRRDYLRLTAEAIAAKLHRSRGAVLGRAHRLGLSREGRDRAIDVSRARLPWDDFETDILRRDYTRLGPLALSERLKRPYDALRQMAYSMGLQACKVGRRQGCTTKTTVVRSLRPRHAVGEFGERIWFASCDAAFQDAMHRVYGGAQ